MQAGRVSVVKSKATSSHSYISAEQLVQAHGAAQAAMDAKNTAAAARILEISALDAQQLKDRMQELAAQHGKVLEQLGAAQGELQAQRTAMLDRMKRERAMRVAAG